MRLGWYLGSNRSESEGEFFRVTVDNPTLCSRWVQGLGLQDVGMACPGRSPEVGAADLDITARPPDRFLAGNTAAHGAGYYPHFSHFVSSLRMPLSVMRMTTHDI